VFFADVGKPERHSHADDKPNGMEPDLF
jgi:hypothetical protein